MATDASRRSFLRAEFARHDLMRPPGALAEALYRESCDGCGECARACPASIIMKDAEGFAVVDFSRGACTFCGDCITACPTGALAGEARAGWTWVAAVSATCFAQTGIACRTCEDFCDERAIRFRLQTGGRAIPMIDEAACTGCGECAAPCPAGAIQFARRKPEQEQLEATG